MCGKDRAVLIDTGLGVSDIKNIVNPLTKLPITVLTTHVHAKKSKADKSSRESEEQRERYMKVMREDFPKDFISDDEWDYIEAMAHWKDVRED